MVAIVGISLTVIISLPLLMTPFIIYEADQRYMEAFGVDPKDIIPANESNFFTKTPFSMPDYFFGVNTRNYRVKENIVYYEGTKGVDKGITLHFDVYMPTTYKKDLPGNHSVLIRIHGGGWTSGDKGSLNNAQLNKHFASQLVIDTII
ncbi:hypothetical protein [Alkalihalobacterium elongatum]|uniref:hypothetical protein n=1 Tax=Alkalihalobacterium elongatum TaxID=2675466 RepID=UPI001C1FA745|nr:hypothetical protein [Alkalihalobacterium elongatum]